MEINRRASDGISSTRKTSSQKFRKQNLEKKETKIINNDDKEEKLPRIEMKITSIPLVPIRRKIDKSKIEYLSNGDIILYRQKKKS